MSSVDIRLAHPADAPALTGVARRAKASWGYPAEWMALWENDLTLTPAYISAHAVFVAGDATRIAGLCALEVNGRQASISHLWIEPDCQRRGIGRALVARALEQARAAGAVVVELLADPFAEAFYLRLGAVRTGAIAAPMPGAPDRQLPRLELRC
jgi:ribosomal protein S18 acetylase RimI-like enzyme